MALPARLRARYRLRRWLGLWYHREYVPSGLDPRHPAATALDRMERAVGLLAREGLLRRADLRRPAPASFGELEAAHARSYLETVSRPDTLGRIFGLEPAEVPVDALLAAQRRAVGGTLAAARAVARGERRVGVNLGGGFHHAEPEQGGGFCVFNDVVAAVGAVRAQGFTAPLAVVDLDFHQGNGTAIALSTDARTLTYSIQGSTWSRLDAAHNFEVELPAGTGDAAYLETLARTLPPLLEAQRPGLVFYVAGNDVLAGDPLGGFALTLDGLFARDRRVVEWVHRLRAGLVVVQGGGYGPDAWRGNARLLRWLLTGSPARVQADPAHARAGFLAVVPAPLLLSEAEVMGQLTGYQVGGLLLLGFFSAHSVEYALERARVLEPLRARGFADLRVALDASDPAHQVVRVLGSKPGSPEALLVELVVRRRRLAPLPAPRAGEALELLSVEWLLLQDPTAAFTPARPAMPGQKHPGLGLAARVVDMLAQLARELGLAGLVAKPARYANALQGARWFHFLDPAAEGRLAALQQVLAGRSLPQAAALMEAGAVRLADGTPLSWEPADQVLPLHPALAAYFGSEEYAEARDRERRRLQEAGLYLAPAAGGA